MSSKKLTSYWIDLQNSELQEIADETYHNPSKHTDIISEIRERRSSSLNKDKMG